MVKKIKTSVQKKESERLKKMYSAVGKKEVLNELFDSLSDKQKEFSVLTFPGKRQTVDEWWKGMTIIEKKIALKNLLKNLCLKY